MKKVVLVGTRHSVQRDRTRTDFECYIVSLLKKYNLVGIAEEIDTATIVADTASSSGLDYQIIEPTPDERQALGIKSQYEIEQLILMDYEDLDTTEAIDKKKELEDQSIRMREQEWLKRIMDRSSFPILIICGAGHFQSFGNLLRTQGVEVIEACSLWE